MTNFIPIFPLEIVVFPGETLNLHIFEPKYIQLINECHTEKKPFGIPVVIDKKVQEFGTLIEITELVQDEKSKEKPLLIKSSGGDTRTKGVKVFRVLEIIKDVPGKLYSGAIVNYPANHDKGSPDLMQTVMSGIRELHKLLNVSKDFKKEDAAIKSYEVAHHIGLSLEEEYELLLLLDEKQRQAFLKRHIAKVVPMVVGMEKLKEKIKLNGHFKNLSGFNI